MNCIDSIEVAGKIRWIGFRDHFTTYAAWESAAACTFCVSRPRSCGDNT